MAKRRPPVPPELAEIATEIAEKVRENERLQALDVRARLTSVPGLAPFRDAFMKVNQSMFLAGVKDIFSGSIYIEEVPIASHVAKNFLEAMHRFPEAEVLPAFHGTDAKNYPSIFTNGLLVPGRGNDLRIVHGAAHGHGVYTAKVTAAWLSKGFCMQSSILLCAVLNTNEVKPVHDALVVQNPEHVIPLFIASAPSLSNNSIRRFTPHPAAVAKQLKPVAVVPPKKSATTTNATAPVKKSEEKTSKFKAKLAARHNRH